MSAKCSHSIDGHDWDIGSGHYHAYFPHFEMDADECTLRRILQQFGYDGGRECYHCESYGWSGTHYCYRYNSDYALCVSCHEDLPWHQKEDWERVAVPWCSTVPSYTLSRGDESDEVRQLQYLLTRLGVMPLSATDQLTGYFGPLTERAIRMFQHRCGFKCYTDEYDKNTASWLQRVVWYYRRQGHKYL